MTQFCGFFDKYCINTRVNLTHLDSILLDSLILLEMIIIGDLYQVQIEPAACVREARVRNLQLDMHITKRTFMTPRFPQLI